jgi:tetratricopeptide (TPR) repeat protein
MFADAGQAQGGHDHVRYSGRVSDRARDGEAEESPYWFIGRNIRKLRKQKKLRQDELGQQLRRRTLTRQAIGSIESGGNTDLETIADIAAALNVDLEVLLQSGSASSASRAERSNVADDGPRQSPRELIDSVLTSPRDEWSKIVVRDPRFQRVDVCIELIERSQAAIDTMPPDAVELGRAGLAIAEQLDESKYHTDVVARLKGSASRQLAYALFYIGKSPAALEHIDRAQREFDRCALSDDDAGRLNIVRAVVYRDLTRYDEALTAAREARRTFESTGSTERIPSAVIAEAYLLIHLDREREALPLLRDVETRFGSKIDPQTRSIVMTNIAICLRSMGKTGEAIAMYERAAAIDVERGDRSGAVFVRVNIGHALIEGGETAAAMRLLDPLRNEARELGMARTTAVVELLLAEAMLMQRRPNEAEELCRSALEYIAAAPKSREAMLALAHLREATEQRNLSRTLVQHARQSVQNLQRRHRFVYAAPPDDGETEHH